MTLDGIAAAMVLASGAIGWPLLLRTWGQDAPGFSGGRDLSLEPQCPVPGGTGEDHQRGGDMAEWPDAAKTVTHYGVMDVSPDGSREVGDYGADGKAAAAQTATAMPDPGHRLELVEFDVTWGPCRVLPGPLEGGTE